MKFEYTTHAEERIRKRKIDRSLLEDAVKNPEIILLSKYGRWIAQRTLKGKVLRVVYEKREDIYMIITAYYTESRRY